MCYILSEELCSLLDVLLLVLISHDNLCATMLQFMLVCLKRKYETWIVSKTEGHLYQMKHWDKATMLSQPVQTDLHQW